jgi:transcriptional regulator with XRE-family HTH domain
MLLGVAPDTPKEILAGNIGAAMGRRRLSQTDLAERMRQFGYSKWSRQTVAETLAGNRRLLAEELLAVAACLETTVQQLMSPQAWDGPVEFPSGVFLAAGQVRSLVFGHGPADETALPSTVRDARDLRGIRWRDNTLEPERA